MVLLNRELVGIVPASREGNLTRLLYGLQQRTRLLKDGFGEQHCRIYCEQNEDQEKTLRCSESEALPCQRPSVQRTYVGSQPLGMSDRITLI